MEFQIPKSLKLEHEELHDDLAKAMRAGGAVEEAAEKVAGVLHDHFVKEEKIALPPIGLLAALAQGKFTDDMKDILAITDRLKAELSEMIEEHHAVVNALKSLIVAAQAENKPEHARFAEKLMLHAETEEEVLYPAAILVGEYVRLRFKTAES